MSEQENMQVVREAFEAINAHDVERYVETYHDSAVFESEAVPGSPFHGSEGIRQTLQMYLNPFPDLNLAIEQMMANGDYVVTRVLATGTHQGAFGDIAPTNRQFVAHGCWVNEVRAGKTAHVWLYFDANTILQYFTAN